MDVGLRFASFDGGKGKAISQLEILCDLMHRLKMTHYANESIKEVLPYEVFDLMGGCDTGGLIVIMLARLQMSAEETRTEFIKLCDEILDVRTLTPSNRSALLRKALEDLLARKDIPLDTRLNDGREDKKCPGFVVVLPRSSLTGNVVLRTYNSRIAPSSPVTILDAALATCASQPEFLPVTISEGSNVHEEYPSAVTGAANPVHTVLAEAFHYFPMGSTVSTVVSFGCGYPFIVQLPKDTDQNERLNALTRISEDCEKVARKFNDEVSGLDIYYRLSVIQGMQRPVSLAYADGERSLITTSTREYLQDPEVDTILERCVDSIHLRRGVRSVEYLTHRGGKLPTHKAIPPLSTSFIARNEPYNQLVQGVMRSTPSMSQQNISVVSGMGGCGKTQLVVNFAHEHGVRFKHVFFVDGSSRTSIMRDLVTYVQNADSRYAQATFQEALDFFQDSNHCSHVIIYDNVDDVDLDLRDLIPKAQQGCIIITTRNRTLGSLASEPLNHIELDVMSEQEALQALLKASRLPTNDANQRIATTISQRLGNLPVALVQAGSYIAEAGCTPEEYLELLDQHLSELMDTPASDRQQRGAYATFDIAYAKIPSSIQNFLHVLSFLHYANFPMASISTAVKTEFRYEPFSYVAREPLFDQAIELLRSTFTSSGSWNALTLNKMIVTMRKFSLATFTEGFNTRLLRIHPLCHTWAKARLPEEKYALFAEAAVRLIVCATQEASMEQYLISHVEALFPDGLDTKMCINDCAALAEVFQNQGMLGISTMIWNKTFDVVSSNTGVNSMPSRQVASHLAKALSRQGDYDNAQQIQELLVEAFRAELGEDDAETVWAMGELASTYQYQGRYAKAIELLEKVLEKERNLEDTTEEKRLLTENNLAHMYFSQGRYAEAEKLQVEALKRHTQSFGPYHRYTLAMKDNLSKTYFAQDRLSEAEKLQVEAVEDSKKHLGPNHPDTLVSMSNLAETYTSMERYQEAEELRNLVFLGQKERLGPTHPRTLASMDNLASVYYELGRISDAQKLQETAVSLYTTTLGSGHPDTLISMGNLAGTYFKLQEYERAAEIQVKVFEMSKENLGATHPNTLIVMGHLATTYRRQERFQEAAELEEVIVSATTESLGRTHPQTLGAMFNLAVSYYDLKRYGEAEEIQVHVLKHRRERFGPLHQATLNALGALDRTYSVQGKHAEAVEIEAEIVAAHKGRTGEDSIETMKAMTDLGFSYYYLRRFEEAEALVSVVLKRYKEVFGPDHPATKSAVVNLAAIYKAQGREEDAEKLGKE